MNVVLKYTAFGIFLLLLIFGIYELKAIFLTPKGCREVCRETELFSGVYACGEDCSGTPNLTLWFFIMIGAAIGMPIGLIQYSMPKKMADYFGYRLLVLEKDEKKRVEYYRSLGFVSVIALAFAYVISAILFLLG